MRTRTIRAGLLQVLGLLLLTLFFGLTLAASAQQMSAPPCAAVVPPAKGECMPPRWQQGSPPMPILNVGPPGRWWDSPEYVKKLSLTSDQQKKMDKIFQQSRLELINRVASLQREDAIMEPLVDADQPNLAKVTAQIDKVVNARAKLETALARMLLSIRIVLTPEQWKKLQAESPPYFGAGGGGFPPPPGGN